MGHQSWAGKTACGICSKLGLKNSVLQRRGSGPASFRGARHLAPPVPHCVHLLLWCVLYGRNALLVATHVLGLGNIRSLGHSIIHPHRTCFRRLSCNSCWPSPMDGTPVRGCVRGVQRHKDRVILPRPHQLLSTSALRGCCAGQRLPSGIAHRRWHRASAAAHRDFQMAAQPPLQLPALRKPRGACRGAAAGSCGSLKPLHFGHVGRLQHERMNSRRYCINHPSRNPEPGVTAVQVHWGLRLGGSPTHLMVASATELCDHTLPHAASGSTMHKNESVRF